MWYVILRHRDGTSFTSKWLSFAEAAHWARSAMDLPKLGDLPHLTRRSS
jgi:hypothetical protein